MVLKCTTSMPMDMTPGWGSNDYWATKLAGFRICNETCGNMKLTMAQPFFYRMVNHVARIITAGNAMHLEEVEVVDIITFL